MAYASSDPSPEAILNRRAMSKRVRLWRALAFLALAAALVAMLWALGAFRGIAGGAHIARVSISGVVTEDRSLVKLLGKLADDPSVAGVVLSVDSPGGTAVGGEAIYTAIRELAAKKPVATSVGTMAASAGYMIAVGSDHIVARNTSIVGSIGVIVQMPQAGGLLEKVGVDVFTVKSAPLKGEPSAFSKEPDPAARAMLQRLVDSSYGYFVDLVADRRPLSREETLELADGSVFSGAQALKLELVDAIGGEDEAVAWMVRERDVTPNLDLRDRRAGENGFAGAFAAWTAPRGSLSETMLGELKRLAPRGLFLDGIVAIWQG